MVSQLDVKRNDIAGFGFSEEQDRFRAEVKEFASRELAPGSNLRAKQRKAPREIFRKMGGKGLLGISVPSEHGGLGLDWVSYAIGLEETSKADPFCGLYMMVPVAAYRCLRFASEALRREWVPPIMSGENVIAFASTEPSAGSDAGAMAMTAVRRGDEYVLNGEKTSIAFGYECDAAILFAKTNPALKAKGVSCLLVPFNIPGISRSLMRHTGCKPAGLASIRFEDVAVPARYLIGDEGKGFHIFAGSGVDFFRPSIGLIALAQAQSSLDEATAYALQRRVFGNVLARFDTVSFKIAEHATKIEAARLLCYRAFFMEDRGLPHSRESAMCKWWCPEVAFAAIHDAILIHGHRGYSVDLPLEQRLRDLIGLEFADGTAPVMKTIIARDILGPESTPH